MPGAPSPPILLKAIAALAAAGGLPGDKTSPMPEAATGTNAASVEGGFPAITMQNELAGGKPPLGQDMNGLFFLVSSHTLYLECGQTYKYNSTLAASIGGYLSGTILGMADETGLWLCTTDGTVSDPDAGGTGWVPIAAYGKTTVTGLTGGIVTLTPSQTKYNVIILQGVLSGNLVVNLPQTIQQWLIINSTSGAFSTTVKTVASGSIGVSVPQGGFTAPVGVYSIGDGNIYPTVAPTNLPIDQDPTPLTIVQRTNVGYIFATLFNSNRAPENFSVSNVFADAGDGYHRKIALTNFEAQVLLQGLAGQLVNGQVPFSVVSQWAAALFSSPALTGVPTAPTAGFGTSNTQIATTAFANPGVTVNGNGICITFPSGYKLQFGTTNPAGGTSTVTFPVPFTSSVFPLATAINNGSSVQCWIRSYGLTTMNVSTTGGSAVWVAGGV